MKHSRAYTFFIAFLLAFLLAGGAAIFYLYA